jgi:SsrA-binding protein
VPGYKPKGERKLLLTKKQIQRLAERTHKTWLVLKPLEVFVTKNWRIKIKLGLAKLKKKIEKRQIIKERDMKRQMMREMKELY